MKKEIALINKFGGVNFGTLIDEKTIRYDFHALFLDYVVLFRNICGQKRLWNTKTNTT